MEIQAASQSDKAVLGEGYNLKQQRFVGECATGTVEFSGIPESSLIFYRSLTSTELSDSLGFTAGGNARFGMVKGSMSARFASDATSSDYSESSIYSAQYRFKNKRLKYTGLTDVGQNAKGFQSGTSVGDNWETICGHEYVEQITLGAALYISVRIEFATKADKQQFNAEAKISGPAFSVSTELNQVSKAFASRASVTVQAYQQGGDVTRLSSIFGVGDNAKVTTDKGNRVHAVLACSMSNPEACLKILDNALEYATSTTDASAFPQQIKPDADFANISKPNGPAELSYIIKPWSDLALLPPPGIVTKLIDEARKDLAFMLDENLSFRSRIISLLTGPIRLSQRQRRRLEQLDAIVSNNLRIIYETSVICYGQLDKCVEAVAIAKQSIEAFDLAELEVHPESIAQWYDLKDQAETNKSIQRLMNYLENIVSERVVDYPKVRDKGGTCERELLKLEELTIQSIAGINTKGVENIEPLASLINLRSLSLSGNDIKDIRALSNLTSLTHLDLANNQISDISPLASLTKLEGLGLSKNKISDLRPLSSLKSIKELGIDSNLVDDLRPISDLANLEGLSLYSNKVTDLSPLSGLVNLRMLFLDGLDLNDQSLMSLEALTELAWLSLSANHIKQLNSLSSLSNLKILNLSSNSITEVTPISSLVELRSLDLSKNDITDVSALSVLTQLTKLRLHSNPVSRRVCPVPDPSGEICEFDPITEVEYKVNHIPFVLMQKSDIKSLNVDASINDFRCRYDSNGLRVNAIHVPFGDESVSL